MARRKRRSGKRRTSQQVRMGKAARACKGKRGGKFTACMRKKLRGPKRARRSKARRARSGGKRRSKRKSRRVVHGWSSLRNMA